MASKSGREKLPFEPRQKKKKTTKASPPTSASKTEKTKNPTIKAKKVSNSGAIPDGVSKRMIRRMAIFCGIPTALAMLSFFIFYWIVSQEWLKIPAPAVGAVTLGLFGLGVLGLTYGMLSASWDEDRIGGWLGWQEFKMNFGRMRTAWGDSRRQAKENRSI